MKLKILGILVIAFLLRIIGVQFGLPHLYHADEPIVVNHALAYGTGDLNPHFFKIPPLVSYLLFALYGIFYLAGKALGLFPQVQDFEAFFYRDPTSFYLIARGFFGVFLGTLTVYALYQLVRKYFSESKALLSSGLLAVCFLHVRDSHYVYADIPLVLIMILSFFPLFELIKAPTLRNHLNAGTWIGLAIAVKYNGAVLIIPYLIASLFGKIPRLRILLYFSSAMMSALLVYSVLNPYTWIDFNFFIREISQQAQAQQGAGWIHHFQYSLREGMTPFLLAVSLLGLGKTFMGEDSKKIVFLGFVLAYYATLALGGQHYDRYVLPLLPFLIFFAADFVFDFCGHFKAKKNVLIFLLIIFMGFPNLAKAVRFNRIMTAPDVRDQAKAWIEAKLPEDSSLALDWDFYMPRLSFSQAQLMEKKVQLELSSSKFSEAQRRRLHFLIRNPSEKSYHLHFLSKEPDASAHRFLFAQPLAAYDLNSLREKNIRYVVTGVFSTHQDPSVENFYNQLKSQAVLLAEFTPYGRSTHQTLLDSQPLTGGPFLWKDLKARTRNGYLLRVYQILPLRE